MSTAWIQSVYYLARYREASTCYGLDVFIKGGENLGNLELKCSFWSDFLYKSKDNEFLLGREGLPAPQKHRKKCILFSYLYMDQVSCITQLTWISSHHSRDRNHIRDMVTLIYYSVKTPALIQNTS